MAAQWRIYYSDGSAFGSEQGDWEDAPIEGVILVAVREGERVDYLAGSDHYAKQDDETYHTVDDLGVYIREKDKKVKHGVWTTHSMYERIQQRAREEFAGEDVNPA